MSELVVGDRVEWVGRPMLFDGPGRVEYVYKRQPKIRVRFRPSGSFTCHPSDIRKVEVPSCS